MADAFVAQLPAPITMPFLNTTIQLTHYRFTFQVRRIEAGEPNPVPGISTQLVAGVLDASGNFLPHAPSLQQTFIHNSDLDVVLAAAGAAKPQGVFRNTDVLQMHRTIWARP